MSTKLVMKQGNKKAAKGKDMAVVPTKAKGSKAGKAVFPGKTGK